MYTASLGWEKLLVIGRRDNPLISKDHFFIAYHNFFYFENRDRFLKTDFTIELPVGQNLEKKWKKVENSKKGWT